METVTLKLNSSDPGQSFDCVDIIPDFDTIEDNYEKTDWTKVKRVHAKYKTWRLNFSLLSVTQQDFLADLKTQEAPQAVIATVTYNVLVKEARAKRSGGYLDLTKTTAE